MYILYSSQCVITGIRRSGLLTEPIQAPLRNMFLFSSVSHQCFLIKDKHTCAPDVICFLVCDILFWFMTPQGLFWNLLFSYGFLAAVFLTSEYLFSHCHFIHINILAEINFFLIIITYFALAGLNNKCMLFQELYLCAVQELSRFPELVEDVLKLQRWTEILHSP